jgi:ankyrin repeat protein
MGLLVSAANGGHVDVVKLVLTLGRDALEDTDDGGYTPLLLAVQRGHLEVVQLLAAHGANLRALTRRHRNDARTLALENATMHDYLAHIWHMTPLQIAVDARLADCVHGWLAAGADPNEASGHSLLELAHSAGPYAGAKAPCPETTALVRTSLRPWTPALTPLYGPILRDRVLEVFRLQHMLARHSPLPRLPPEIWVHIASFMSRGPLSEGALRPMLHTDKRRVLWRQRRFGLPADVELDALLPGEDDIERPDMMAVDPAPGGRSSPTATAAASGSLGDGGKAGPSEVAMEALAANSTRITWV